MTDHFAFLFEDADREFFQSVAADRAMAPLLEKSAATRGADKLAREVDADLALVEHAGPVGLGLGMTKRAMAHLERLADDPRLLARPEAMPALFGKVAAAAVARDLEETTGALIRRAAPEEEAEVRREVAKVALELVTALEELRAGLDKSAAGLGIGGLGRAGLMAKQLRGASNLARGAAGAAAEGLGRVGRNVRGAVGAVGEEIDRVGRKIRAGRALNARANVRQIGREMADSAKAGRSTGAARAVAAGQERQLANAQATLAKRRSAAVAKSPAGTTGVVPQPPKPRPGAVPKPAGAAPPAGPKKKRAGKGTAEAEAQAAEEGTSGMVGTLKKLHGQGWSALSPTEKTHVVGGGLGLIEGHRLMTGRDLVTGEKDDE